ncbi:sulfate permease [Piromyces finnis]|uniref:Sulfate permease n=1 Tax=Piromyces finnis TaxID=1754191 RepID=A0A1Y1VJU7_9FUNG|nr:sulfate permease [Piromyces finnis]|eukprot:ORX56656.1 sulfate permease [Piromyces finnis]
MESPINSNNEVEGALNAPITETTPLINERRPSYYRYERKKRWNIIKYYVPVLSWLPKYSFRDLQFDILSGLTIGSVLIPQGLSYASNLVKINPIYGLYSCIVPVLIYALLGTSRQISIGPEAVISIMTGSTISEYIRRNSAEFANSDDMNEHRAELAFLITAIVGILTLIFGLFRLGFLDSVLSRALLTGFTSAVATVIFFEQTPLLLGISSSYETTSPIEKFIYIMKHYLGECDKRTIIISVVCILFLLIFDILKGLFRKSTAIQRFPHILVIVLTTIYLSAYYDWNGKGISILGKVNTDVSIKHPVFSIKRINGLFVPSILIAVIGFVEALIITKKYSSKYKYSVSPNRELVAFGSLNIVGSFFGAMPTYASLSRSRINDTSGGKSQVSGIVASGVIYCTIKYLLKYFEYLPVPVMASIISVAALGLIEVKDIIYFFKVRSVSDILLMLLIYFTTIFFSISDGILISVSLSLLLVVRKTTTPRLKVLGKYKVIDEKTGLEKFKFKSVKKDKSLRNNSESIDDGDKYKVEQIEGVLIISFGDNLFFGNTGQLKERFRRIEVYRQIGIHPGEDPHMLDPDYENHPIQEIILDFKNVGSIDACATQILSEIIQDYHERNIGVSIIKLNECCKKQFKNSGLYDKIESNRYFNKISDCLDALSVYEPGLPHGVNWKVSKGIIYPRDGTNHAIHDGTSIQWDSSGNILGSSFSSLESSQSHENFENNFIRYRLSRKPSNFVNPSSQNKNHSIYINEQYDEPLPITDSNFSTNTNINTNHHQRFTSNNSNITNLRSGAHQNQNDSFNLMNNTNIWGNGSESDANNISLNFDITNQIFNPNNDDVFNQTSVWDSKSVKSNFNNS